MYIIIEIVSLYKIFQQLSLMKKSISCLIVKNLYFGVLFSSILQHCTQDVRFKFGRSNSHSHTSGRSGRKSTSSQSVENTVCHKSLPDLHTSTRRRASLSPRASTKSSKPSGHHQSSSNCPDCETSSDYSEHSFKRDAVCYRRYSKHFHICDSSKQF